MAGYLSLTCLPEAPALRIANSEKFGTFSLQEQLSDKQSDLPMDAATTVVAPL
jgi:hypothetical protein